MKSFKNQTHYEVLEVSVAATSTEIEYAFLRLMKLYSDDQVALYGLIDSGHALALRARISAARDVLCDDAKRDGYDRQLGLPPREVESVRSNSGSHEEIYEEVELSPPTFVPSPKRSAPAPQPAPFEVRDRSAEAPHHIAAPAESPPREPHLQDAPPPAEIRAPPQTLDEVSMELEPIDLPMYVRESGEEIVAAIVASRTGSGHELRNDSKPRVYDMPEGVEFNGDMLRQVRMARGMCLIQLAERTRIGLKHIENIEHDRYELLPASVYLRGYLMSLSRELGLDGIVVTKSYLAFVEAHGSKG